MTDVKDPVSPIKEPFSPTDEDANNLTEHVEYKSSTRRHKDAEERQAELNAALAIDPGVSAGSLRAFKMYLIVLCVCCCSGDSGFDGTVMGGINSMTQYQHYFGMKSAGAKTGIVFGVFTVGSLAGAIPSAILPDAVGRRFSMWFGNLVLIIGAVVTGGLASGAAHRSTGTATRSSTFIGGRFLTGLGSACAGASAKSYLAEITPPQHRGKFLGLLNSFYYVGQMTATGMMVATGAYAENNEWSWRLPLFVQIVPAALNVIFIFLCPESPRWLYSRGKTDRARQILANLHSRNGDIRSPLIDLEITEIDEYIGVEQGHWWDFRPLFRTRSDRYRSWMVVLIGSFGQLSGNGLITYFLPVLLKNAGIVSQNKILTLNFVNSVTSFLGALTGSALVDRVGRRSLLLWSTSLLVVTLTIVSALLSHPETSPQRSSAGIAFIYLFMVIFSYGWTPMQALYGAEVLGFEARAKGLAFMNIVTQAASCINTFGLPVALEKIGWKVYLIFLFWDLFEVTVIYFTVAETKGLTLEEINEVFEQPNPRKYSTQKKFKISSVVV